MVSSSKDIPSYPRKYFHLWKNEGTLKAWFFRVLTFKFEKSKGMYPFGNYYEFGVGEGGTLIAYLRAASGFCEDNNVPSEKLNIFAFDSFKGLPKSELKEDAHPAWSEGKFSFSQDEVKKRIEHLELENKPNITFIEGFFEETLTESLREKLSKNPPVIITIDVDYYSSTKTIFNWLKPILPSGTLFFFDDIWSFGGNPNYGELKAIREFNEEDCGYLTPFPLLGMASKAYMYSKKVFEFKL